VSGSLDVFADIDDWATDLQLWLGYPYLNKSDFSYWSQ
jgi:hypothetical protein